MMIRGTKSIDSICYRSDDAKLDVYIRRALHQNPGNGIFTLKLSHFHMEPVLVFFCIRIRQYAMFTRSVENEQFFGSNLMELIIISFVLFYESSEMPFVSKAVQMKRV